MAATRGSRLWSTESFVRVSLARLRRLQGDSKSLLLDMRVWGVRGACPVVLSQQIMSRVFHACGQGEGTGRRLRSLCRRQNGGRSWFRFTARLTQTRFNVPGSKYACKHCLEKRDVLPPQDSSGTRDARGETS